MRCLSNVPGGARFFVFYILTTVLLMYVDNMKDICLDTSKRTYMIVYNVILYHILLLQVVFGIPYILLRFA